MKNDTNSNRGDRLRYFRNLLGNTLKEMAARCDVGESTLRLWERGAGGGLSLRGANKIINGTQSADIICSVEWLMDGTGKPPTRKADLLAGKSRIITASDINDEISLEINHFMNTVFHAVSMKIRDNAMAPEFFKNDYAAGIIHYKDNIEKLNHKTCIVQTEENVMLLRHIEKINQSDNKYNLYIRDSQSGKLIVEKQNIKLAYAAPVLRIWRAYE